MELIYRSTRNANETATASEAILKGLANEGGLFVPDSIPALDVSLTDLAQMNYQQVAYEVMKLMFTDFTEEELKHCINSAYDKKFDTPEIAPLVLYLYLKDCYLSRTPFDLNSLSGIFIELFAVYLDSRILHYHHTSCTAYYFSDKSDIYNTLLISSIISTTA